MTRAYVQSHVWTNAEDVILQAAISKYGLHSWHSVSTMLKNKTPAECKSRWYEYLSPSIKKDQWTPEEEQLLLTLAKALPNQWQTIAAQLHRTTASCVGKYTYLSKVASGLIKPGEDGKGDEGDKKSSTGEGASKTDRFNYNSRAENRAARPDAHDFDEGERELIQTAQARIANTAGKKDKRRMREAQLKDAKEAAKLAHLRQLEAAGVVVNKGRADEFKDIQDRIALEKSILARQQAGQFTTHTGATLHLNDTSEERLKEMEERSNEQFVGKSVAELQGLSQKQKIQLAKEKAMKKQDEQKTKNVAAYIMKQALLNDNLIIHQRGQLSLPDVGDGSSSSTTGMGMVGQQQSQFLTTATVSNLTKSELSQQQQQSLQPQQATKRKQPPTGGVDSAPLDQLLPTSIPQHTQTQNQNERDAVSTFEAKRTRFTPSSMDSMLTSLDSNAVMHQANGNRLGSLSDLSSKLSSLPQATQTGDLASKLGALGSSNNVSSSSEAQRQQQTITRPTLIKNINPFINPSLTDTAIVNLDADLKAKILQFQQRLQTQKMSKIATSAKNATIFAQGPPLPRLLDTSFKINWPIDTRSVNTSVDEVRATTNQNGIVGQKDNHINNQQFLSNHGLSSDDQNQISLLLQQEFTQLMQADMSNTQLDSNIFNEIRLAKEIVAKEEHVLRLEMENAAKLIQKQHEENQTSNFTLSQQQHSPTPPPHLATPSLPPAIALNPSLNMPFNHRDPHHKASYFDPRTGQFATLSRNEFVEGKNVILRQQALLYYKWLEELLFDRKAPAAAKQSQPSQNAGKLKLLEQQSKMEFRGYLKKQQQFSDDFTKNWQQSRELFHDYSFFAQFQQGDAQIIESRANGWSELYNGLQKQHNDLQQLYLDLQNGDLDINLD